MKRKKLIMEYISDEECGYICKNELFDCCDCNNLDECYEMAKIECNDNFNHSFAESIAYGGYDTEEEFWNELFE